MKNAYTDAFEHLLKVIQELSLAKNLKEIIDITRKAARRLTGADGASFVLREDQQCYYVDEDAIEPLWKGKKFDINLCVSGWSMLHKQSVSIEDIFKDPRIPLDAYKKTFVKSLLMVPIRPDNPIGAIGIYWAKKHVATEEELSILEALAQSTSIAIENVLHIEKLKEINLAKDEFLSIVTHELRTPLSAIKLQLQLTERKMKKAKILDDFGLSVSLGQLDGLASLVEQLLEVSKIQMSELRLNFKDCNLSDVVTRSANLWSPKLQNKISLDIEENIIGCLDELSIELVLNNLFSNVAKHASGSNVKIALHRKKNRAIMTFDDDGPGIPKAIQKKLFERFERGISPRYIRGLGLGLYIAKSFIMAHKGEINLESDEGKGCRFKIDLPLKN